MNAIPEIPGYHIKKEIGRGGMARIFSAIDRISDRKVALKVFMPTLINEKDARARFVSEGEILSKLNHKNIVPVYDVGSFDDLNYISVEYLEGKSLKDRIHPDGGDRISVKESLSVIKSIAGALAYSHSRGLIHRDIKPENILFRADDTPVLVDFGIAKDFSAGENLTMTGTSIGTPFYMSPEQIKGLPPDQKNDIYSLGVVLYEMLTGEIPYKGTDIITVAIKHERDPIPTLPTELSNLQELINRMMAKNSNDRPSGGNEVIDLIDLWDHRPDIPPVNDKGIVFRKVRRKLLKIMLFLAVFLIPVITGHLMKKGSDVQLTETNKIIKKNIEKEKPPVIVKTIRKILPDFQLRTRNKIISEEEITISLIKYNFFDSAHNPNGNFINRYKTEVYKQQKVVIDGKTGLMWDYRGSFKSMSISSARKWIKELNNKKFAGFSNWRLPTIEEGASLLEKKKWYGDLHIFSVFSIIQKEIWTSDIKDSKNSNWIISFKKGRIKNVSLFRKRSFVRAVRKIH